MYITVILPVRSTAPYWQDQTMKSLYIKLPPWRRWAHSCKLNQISNWWKRCLLRFEIADQTEWLVVTQENLHVTHQKDENHIFDTICGQESHIWHFPELITGFQAVTVYIFDIFQLPVHRSMSGGEIQTCVFAWMCQRWIVSDAGKPQLVIATLCNSRRHTCCRTPSS